MTVKENPLKGIDMQRRIWLITLVLLMIVSVSSCGNQLNGETAETVLSTNQPDSSSSTVSSQPATAEQKPTFTPTTPESNYRSRNQLAFLSNHESKVDIYLLDVENKRITPVGVADFLPTSGLAYSPNNNTMAFFGRNNGIYTVDLSCLELNPPTCDQEVKYIISIEGLFRGELDFSADGSKIYYSDAPKSGEFKNPEIWEVDLNNYLIERITDIGGWQPSISDDQGFLIFTSPSTGKEEGELFIYELENSSPPIQLTKEVGDSFDADISSDGQRVIFASSAGTRFEGTWQPILHLAELNDKSINGVEGLGIVGKYPCWAPNNSDIVFQQDNNIVVLNLDNGVEMPIVYFENFGDYMDMFPIWIP